MKLVDMKQGQYVTRGRKAVKKLCIGYIDFGWNYIREGKTNKVKLIDSKDFDYNDFKLCDRNAVVLVNEDDIFNKLEERIGIKKKKKENEVKNVTIKIDGKEVDLGADTAKRVKTELELVKANPYVADCYTENSVFNKRLRAKTQKKLDKQVSDYLQRYPFNQIETFVKTASVVRKASPIATTKFKA